MKRDAARAEKDELRAVVSTRLQAAMDVRGMSYRQVAYVTDTPFSCVWNWANGYTLPQTQMVCRLADVLHVSTDWLLGRTDRMEVPEDPLLLYKEMGIG